MWQTLGAVAPTELADARLQLHHAAQIASAVGRVLVPKRDDDSHTNLGWLPEIGALASHPADGVQAALVFADLQLRLLGPKTAALELIGKTAAASYGWLAHQLETDGDLASLHYEIPAFDGPFTAAPFDEVARWFSNAHYTISEYGEVRCWPHHFDIATLIALGDGKTVGVGLSPGDESYNEPYWYVSPYPYPKDADLPELPHGGHWHTKGFTAAILTGSKHLEADNQEQACREFLASAVDSSKQLAGA